MLALLIVDMLFILYVYNFGSKEIHFALFAGEK